MIIFGTRGVKSTMSDSHLKGILSDIFEKK